jgi:ribonuclease HI
MKDCLFCKIVNGEIPCYKVYEDEWTLAFLDISNDANGHTLVVPKTHAINVLDADEKTLSRVFNTVKKVSKHYKENCGFDGVNIISNCGESAEQSVLHLHVHIIPRKSGDGMQVFPNLPKNSESLEEICEKLKIQDVKIDDQLSNEEDNIENDNSVILYTDGACSGNPGIGGWGAILKANGKEKVLSGGDEMTTNNKMELMAVICGLEAIKKPCKVDVYSDSAYVVNAFLQNWIGSWLKTNWKNGQVLNIDLWKRLLVQTKRHEVTWHKVKGHADNELNNRCDEIARGEIMKKKIHG